MRNDVIRRLEIYADGTDAFDKVRRALQEATIGQPAGSLQQVVAGHVEARAVKVCLRGSPSVTARIRSGISSIPGVQVLRDFLDVPALNNSRKGPEYPDQEALLRIDPDEISRTQQGTGSRVIVAIVDSGIMVDHPVFKGHLWTTNVDGQDVRGARCMGGKPDYDLTDQDGHGTMLAGSILATANFFGGLELMAVKFFDVMTQPAAANASQAIKFAVDNKADIINLSFDLGIGSDELEDAIAYAGKAGALVVLAAGNTGSNNDRYPLVPAVYARSCRDNSIVVMATDRYDERAMISNFGRETVDLAAPGVKVVTTRASVGGAALELYGRYTGTSAAAAQVSGAAALLKSQDPSRTAPDLKRILMKSVDLSPRLKCVSGGRLNLGRALGLGPT